MNVQIHRAVTNLTGLTRMTILRAIVAGERNPARLAAHRNFRCRKTAQELEKCLTGNWREEHLFNLASALRLFDALETEIATYEVRLLAELEKLQPPERDQEPVPAHHNAAKERSIKARGNQQARTALWRFADVDLTRIDGINAGIAQIVFTEAGTELAAFPSEHNFVSWLHLKP